MLGYLLPFSTQPQKCSVPITGNTLGKFGNFSLPRFNLFPSLPLRTSAVEEIMQPWSAALLQDINRRSHLVVGERDCWGGTGWSSEGQVSLWG